MQTRPADTGGNSLLLPIQLLPPHLIPMLSSISSFLPSALQIGSEKSPPPSQQPGTLSESPTKADEEDMAVDEHGVKKKKERTNEVRNFSPVKSSPQNLAPLLGIALELSAGRDSSPTP